jgi:hypothetical protein
MTALEIATLRQLAVRVLKQQAGRDADAAALAAAARRAYDELARVVAPLIGQAGVDALTGRAVHLAQRKYPWLVLGRDGTPGRTERTPGTPPPEQADAPFDQVIFGLERQDPAVATEAAGAVFATFTGLLVTFIGEPLTASLVRKAWPDAFSDGNTEEHKA